MLTHTTIVAIFYWKIILSFLDETGSEYTIEKKIWISQFFGEKTTNATGDRTRDPTLTNPVRYQVGHETWYEIIRGKKGYLSFMGGDFSSFPLIVYSSPFLSYRSSPMSDNPFFIAHLKISVAHLKHNLLFSPTKNSISPTGGRYRPLWETLI